MRYLTECKEDYSNLRLIANLNIIDRALRLIARLSADVKAGFRDHAIATYCKKLEVFALKRLGEH
jgi:hypothetical protein